MAARVAVLGASGFVGGRVVEALHLAEIAEMRPVVRRASGLAALSKFDLDGRVADARDHDSLVSAFERCDAVVHAVAGDAATITGSIAPVYLAAQAAGVRRLVYLSSASVHGQAPEPGTDERSVLSERQPLPYNNAKVRAERKLFELRAGGTVEVVVLRPGIVTGPRSNWVCSFVERLLDGTATIVEPGDGICNSVYVDNLVHAICLAMHASAADGQAFLVGDAEKVTWADLHRPIANAFGVELEQLPRVRYQPRRRTPLDLARTWKSTERGAQILSLMPSRLRYALYAAIVGAPPVAGRGSATAAPDAAVAVEATLEMALLQRCSYKLPDAKARALLGYRPIISFAESIRRTLQWLEFAGYPVDWSRFSMSDSGSN